MYLKILKKDIRRKKSMHLILLIFVLLATMFISSSLNNMLVVTSGVDYFFEQAEIGDYLFATMNVSYDAEDANEKKIQEFMKTQKNIAEATRRRRNSFLLYRKDLVTLKYKSTDSYRAKKRSAKDVHRCVRRIVAKSMQHASGTQSGASPS